MMALYGKEFNLSDQECGPRPHAQTNVARGSPQPGLLCLFVERAARS